MPEISISKLDLNQKAVESLAREISRELSGEIVEYVRDYVEEIGAVATGKYLKSITASIIGSPSSALLVSIGSSAESARAIEEGLPPGTPINTTKIREWMAAKGLDASNVVLVNSIVNKLYREGTEAKAVFETVYNSDRINVIIDRTVDRLLEKIEWTK